MTRKRFCDKEKEELCWHPSKVWVFCPVCYYYHTHTDSLKQLFSLSLALGSTSVWSQQWGFTV